MILLIRNALRTEKKLRFPLRSARIKQRNASDQQRFRRTEIRKFRACLCATWIERSVSSSVIWACDGTWLFPADDEASYWPAGKKARTLHVAHAVETLIALLIYSYECVNQRYATQYLVVLNCYMLHVDGSTLTTSFFCPTPFRTNDVCHLSLPVGEQTEIDTSQLAENL